MSDEQKGSWTGRAFHQFLEEGLDRLIASLKDA